jgi:hypothetical protein
MINQKIDINFKNNEYYKHVNNPQLLVQSVKNSFSFDDLLCLGELVALYTGLTKEEAEKRVLNTI